MSRAKKPTHLKVMQNDVRPCRESADTLELPLASEIPAPPNWMPNAQAVLEWSRLAPILFYNKLLTEASLTTLGHLCALHGKISQLYLAGEAPTGHMVAQYRAMANDFGLTPVAQGKVKSGGGEDKKNRFAKYAEQ